jgi:hypothetical protein
MSDFQASEVFEAIQGFEAFDNVLVSLVAAGLHPLRASSDPGSAGLKARAVLARVSGGNAGLPVITRYQAWRLSLIHPFTAEEIFEGFSE